MGKVSAPTYPGRMGDSSTEEAVRLASQPGITMLIGGLDAGKTSVALEAVRAALAAGRRPVLVDADVGVSTVGPPACVSMKVFESLDDLDRLDQPDGLHFVGTTTPTRLVLQQVIATTVMTNKARELGDVVIIDTAGVVSGVAGETLKYHKTELCRPDRIVALQRGEELEPLVGMLRRFFGVEVHVLASDPGLIPMSPDERAHKRSSQFARALKPPLERWKVRPTVFAPTLPMGLQLERLDGVLVGIQGGNGECLGLGVLDHEEDGLRVETNAGEGMTGLRLGSLRIDRETFQTTVINLRELMFGV